MSDIFKKILELQQTVKVPKGQYNPHGNFNYRSCEDILEKLKPHLGGYAIMFHECIEMIGDRYYVKVDAVLSDGKNSHSATAYAREPEEQKGMNKSQITGSASSYARKYALCSLLAIDGEPDPDEVNQGNQANQPYNKDNVKTRNSTSRNVGETKRNAGDYIMPFGPIGIGKKKISEIDLNKLIDHKAWLTSNNKGGKFSELIKNIEEYISGLAA